MPFSPEGRFDIRRANRKKMLRPCVSLLLLLQSVRRCFAQGSDGTKLCDANEMEKVNKCCEFRPR